MKRGRLGFTLIELLVVIGIIAVLIAILIPVVSRVRLAAQTANTTNQMHKISAAIQTYQHDFLAYPGALPNAAFAPPGPGGYFKSGSLTNAATYTQTEDAALAMLGGLQGFNQGGTILLDWKPAEIGLGPVSFNPLQYQAGSPVVLPRKSAYIERRPEDFTPLAGGNPVQLKTIAELGLTYVNDSEAPEFMDLYSNPRPIVYMRANVGAKSIGGASQTIIYNSRISNTFRADVHYDIGVVQPYLNSAKDFPPASGQPSNFATGNLDPNATAVQAYFTSSSGNTAKNAGSFMLIDAGPDRIFGTADDIIVGAGGGQ
jgi:prepilin-type N-terminal cleavage/methylation domain-containing protein